MQSFTIEEYQVIKTRKYSQGINSRNTFNCSCNLAAIMCVIIFFIQFHAQAYVMDQAKTKIETAIAKIRLKSSGKSFELKRGRATQTIEVSIDAIDYLEKKNAILSLCSPKNCFSVHAVNQLTISAQTNVHKLKHCPSRCT